MQLIGNLKTVRDIQQISASFQKREFVIETLDQYPQTIQLELHQDKADIIDAYALGEEKVFNTLVCWKIQRANSTNPPSNQAQTQTSPQEFKQANQPNSFVDGDEDDGLPF